MHRSRVASINYTGERSLLCIYHLISMVGLRRQDSTRQPLLK
jgi:hypothetical protein